MKYLNILNPDIIAYNGNNLNQLTLFLNTDGNSSIVIAVFLFLRLRFCRQRWINNET